MAFQLVSFGVYICLSVVLFARIRKKPSWLYLSFIAILAILMNMRYHGWFDLRLRDLKDLSSVIAGSMSSILALVLAVTLVVTQHSAQYFSLRTMDILCKKIDLKFMLLIYSTTISLSLVVKAIYVDSEAISTCILLLLFSGLYCITILPVFVIRMISLMKPESIFDLLMRKHEKGKSKARFTLEALLDIANKSEDPELLYRCYSGALSVFFERIQKKEQNDKDDETRNNGWYNQSFMRLELLVYRCQDNGFLGFTSFLDAVEDFLERTDVIEFSENIELYDIRKEIVYLLRFCHRRIISRYSELGATALYNIVKIWNTFANVSINNSHNLLAIVCNSFSKCIIDFRNSGNELLNERLALYHTSRSIASLAVLEAKAIEKGHNFAGYPTAEAIKTLLITDEVLRKREKSVRNLKESINTVFNAYIDTRKSRTALKMLQRLFLEERIDVTYLVLLDPLGISIKLYSLQSDPNMLHHLQFFQNWVIEKLLESGRTKYLKEKFEELAMCLKEFKDGRRGETILTMLQNAYSAIKRVNEQLSEEFKAAVLDQA